MGDEPRDPFDSLKGSDPIDPARLPGPDSPMGRRIYERATSSKRRRPPTSHKTVVLLALFGLRLVAAGVFVFNQVTQPGGVVCYADTSLDSDRAVVDPKGTFEAGDCREVWRDGPLTNPNIEPGEIPPLQACVNQEGTLVVFPTNDPAICGDLGLASPASGGEESRLESIASVEERLVNYIGADRCPGIEEAARYAEEALVQAQLDQWTVVARQPSEERPCASFAIDPAVKTITVVPIPNAP